MQTTINLCKLALHLVDIGQVLVWLGKCSPHMLMHNQLCFRLLKHSWLSI